MRSNDSQQTHRKPTRFSGGSFTSVIAITGTPGTGKSTLARTIKRRCKSAAVVEINDIVKKQGLFSRRDRSGSMVVDLKRLDRAIKAKVNGIGKNGKVAVLVGHLAPELSLRYDVAVVTRTDLRTLMKRLKRRHYSSGKITENIRAEALDYCGEAIKGKCSELYEVESAKGRDAVLKYIVGTIKGEGRLRKPKATEIDKLGELYSIVKSGMLNA